MSTPTLTEIKDAAKTAAKEVLESGAAAYSHSGRSQTNIDPVRALEAARMADAMDREESYGVTTLADMRVNTGPR